MASREFEWIDYEVLLPTPLTTRMSSLIVAQDAAPEAQAPGAEAMTRLCLPLPNLKAFPTPADKAKILLESAAEVEHALLVQYLYAAYSLKSPDQVTEQSQMDVLDDSSVRSWPQTLRAIAHEEMGHMMTVQNLLILLGLAPNFERQDCPPRTDIYPFPLKLGPLSRSSLAKYVVAEAPWDAENIGEIAELATEKAGSPINHVGIIYGLLGAIFCRQDQIEDGATGHDDWDAIVRLIAHTAYKQDAVRKSWHLPDDQFHSETVERQADPDDWQVGRLRVHRVTDRNEALQAIRDIGEQGEGPATGDETSHFDRFLGIFNGADGEPGFPLPGEWVPTRPVPTNPKASDIDLKSTRDWAKLGDARYGLLLGFLYHYLCASGQVRQILTGWIFAEMRSRLGFIARELTSRPVSADPASTDRAGMAFQLPELLALPDDEAARWGIHRDRTEEAISIATELRSMDALDARDEYLAALLASDQARLQLMSELAEHGEPTLPTSFVRDIQPLFRPKDIEHMLTRLGPTRRIDLANRDVVNTKAQKIVFRLESEDDSGVRMPEPPDPRWTPTQVQLLKRWIDEGSPP